MRYVLQVGVTVAQIVLSFYGFWLVWRSLLPLLPGPADPDDRIAPYDCYFTDPFVLPLARGLRVPHRVVAVALLIAVTAAQVGLTRLSAAL